MVKNTAGQKIGAQMTAAADGTDFTSAVTCYVTGDAGTLATGTVGSGACVHEGHGYHTYAPSQAETNYDLIAFTFAGSGAITVTVQVATSVITGDAYSRLGAPVGASISADIAAVKAILPTALVAGRMDSSVGAMVAGIITSTVVADGTIDRATFAVDTGFQTIRSNTAQAGAATTITLDASASSVTDFYKNTKVYLTGGTGVGQERAITAYNGTTKVATVSTWATNPAVGTTFAIVPDDAVVSTGGSGLDAAATRAALGMASANLDTQLSTIDDFLDTEVAAIKTKTDQLTFTVSNQIDANVIDWKGATAPAMTGDAYAVVAAILPDSVPADGTRPTMQQAVYMIVQYLMERSVSGTSCVVRKADGTTTLLTLTLGDATAPLSITRTG